MGSKKGNVCMWLGSQLSVCLWEVKNATCLYVGGISTECLLRRGVLLRYGA